MSLLVGFLSCNACCLFSKPADFGIVDLGEPQISKPVDDISQVQPDPATTEVQLEPKVGDTPAGTSEETPAGERKEVATKKTSSADVGKNLLSDLL